MDDLVVGSPFYSEAGHGGAIYVYINSEKVNVVTFKFVSAFEYSVYGWLSTSLDKLSTSNSKR